MYVTTSLYDFHERQSGNLGPGGLQTEIQENMWDEVGALGTLLTLECAVCILHSALGCSISDTCMEFGLV